MTADALMAQATEIAHALIATALQQVAADLSTDRVVHIEVLDNPVRKALVAKVTRARRFKRPPASAPDATEAAQRRAELLAVIRKQEHGATVADLKRLTPKMDGIARSNELQRLKAAGSIQRAGNAWVLA